MMQTDTSHEAQRLLREHAEYRFVDSTEFCSLLLGFKRLVRADEAALGMRGLLDLDTGVHYLIEQENLNHDA